MGVSSTGRSLDQPNSSDANDGTYNYVQPGGTVATAANSIDNLWIQTTNIIGDSVWDLGFQATKAAIFNTVDHGPLPQEAIESTVYLSNDQITWVQAVTERVWMEGIYSDTSVLWDGFAYAVGTPTNETFRYASIIWGGQAPCCPTETTKSMAYWGCEATSRLLQMGSRSLLPWLSSAWALSV